MIGTFEVNENVVMYAFRYALGRSTYAVMDMSDFIIANKNSFTEMTRKRIVYEIKRYYESDWSKNSMQCDRDCWDNVVRELEA